MYHPRLYGTFYEMGLKYGQLLKKNGFKLPILERHKRSFGATSYQLLKQFYPDVEEEIEGFAMGIEEEAIEVAAFLLCIGVFDVSGQCSVFAYKNKNNVVVGRNYDMLYQFKKFTESSLIAPLQKYAYIGHSDLFIGRTDGINEKGLFIAMTLVNGTQKQVGINFYFIIRKVLEDCQTVLEAIALIQSAPVSMACNFLLADAQGELAVVESAPQRCQVRHPKNKKNFICATNQFMHKNMCAMDKGGVEWSRSLERYQSLEDQLGAENELNLNQAKEILSNKLVCLQLKKEQFGTIWSWVANLNTLAIERAETKPTIKNYKPDTRLNWWLNRR